MTQAAAQEIISPRLLAVARMIREKRAGATTEEIVEAAKAGLVTEQQAIAVLERQFEDSVRNRWQKEVPCGDAVEHEVDIDAHTECDVMLAEVRNVLLQVLNDFPPRQRQAVELFFFEGYSVTQITSRLSVARQTVAEHIAAGLARIVSSVENDPAKLPMSLPKSDETLYPFLMRMEWRKQKKSRHPIYPYELWRRYNVAGYWAGNGIYATQYEDKLSQYLEDCFGCAGVAIPRGV